MEVKRRQFFADTARKLGVAGCGCTRCGLCERSCPTEQAAIRVLNPRLAMRKIGRHDRLSTSEPVPELNRMPSFSPPTPPPRPARRQA